MQGALLVLAVLATTLWCAVAAYGMTTGDLPGRLILTLEIIRDAAWFAFLLRILVSHRHAKDSPRSAVRAGSTAVFGLCACVLLFGLSFPDLVGHVLPFESSITLLLLGYILLAVVGLVLVEQLFRNTQPDQLYAVKYLCFGIGGIFAYDFFIYSHALLFKRIDLDLWNARGAINTLVVPLVAISVVRNPQWSLSVVVSHRIVFHTTTLLGAGSYLLVMAAVGYYLRTIGGSWGAAAQAVFLFGAGLVLAVLLFSAQLRAELRVFLSKHFFKYKYDYRNEWLRFMRTLGGSEEEAPLRQRVIRGIGQIVESLGGILWLRSDGNMFFPVAHWNMRFSEDLSERSDSQLIRFLGAWQWVINLEEYQHKPELYGGLQLPEWLVRDTRAWLVVPLMEHEALLGFIVLARSRARISFNWEDSDLLKIAGRQAASHLAQAIAAQALSEARQFEAFNRLSAFVVHDLKNLVAQLSLLVSNAERHKHNPAFIDDGILTIQHSVNKMNRLLGQLRSGMRDGPRTLLDLMVVLREVVVSMSAGRPAPELNGVESDLYIMADPERLASIVGHIIQNAQEATPSHGYVKVRAQRQGAQALVEIEDNGCGMDTAFIRERLFRPFDSTKGSSGMGIGACESREYVRSMGGDIHVQSQIGRGTTFQISIPLAAQVSVLETGTGTR
jgi:putative PEP-CTERM system histidine kinase